MHKTVFISRKLEADGLLAQALSQHGLQVNDIPLIDTTAVSFNPNIPYTNWIFFSSSNAVKFFFAGKPILTNQKFAALGNATATALKQYVSVDFTGETSDVTAVAKSFSKLLQDETVLFPQAVKGLQTIQKDILPEQVVDLVCYATEEKPVPVGDADILVFSSPSNVRAYLRMNRIRDFQFVIAFGNSTATALNEQGVAKVSIPISLNDEDLLHTIIAAARS